MNQNKDKYPLFKLNDLIEWTAIADILRKAKQYARRDKRGNQSYGPLKMFKAILLGQWHSLNDPVLEHALSVRADFIIFCDDEWLQNTLVEVLRIKNTRGLAQVITSEHAQQSLEDLDIYAVFEKCLDAQDTELTNRDELMQAYREIVQSLTDDDK